MPQELPGLYYDAEKNRYFPIKGPIPGSSSNRQRKSSPPPKHIPPNESSHPKTLRKVTNDDLLKFREVCGNIIASGNRKLNFQFEYHKRQASLPQVWKYHGTERMVDRSLEQINVDVATSDGTVKADILLAGGLHGTLCLFDEKRVRQQLGHWENFTADQIWPSDGVPQVRPIGSPRDLQRNVFATWGMPSDITCIKRLPKLPVSAGDASSDHVLITTLGSEASPGSVYHLHFREPIDYSRVQLAWRNIDEITSFNHTIWTADCHPDGRRAVIGTNRGAIMVDIETGVQSSVCRCESDVLSLQIDPSGSFVLCGLRNGAILTLDARQKPEDYSARLARHRILHPLSKSFSKRGGSSATRRFERKGNLYPDCTIFMPSSVSCLASLDLYDQYFCASSMDGSIKLYDHRLIQRGAVQSYEGNVNSHTHIRFGVDAAERILMSGGEDCNLRLWSIKTGELLFENKFMNSTPSIVCWPRTEGLQSKGEHYGKTWENNCYGAWLGSQDGLFYVNWSWNAV